MGKGFQEIITLVAEESTPPAGLVTSAVHGSPQTPSVDQQAVPPTKPLTEEPDGLE